MKENMLALVSPYFGKLPAHFQLWLNSCAVNPQVTWLLYTDDRSLWDYPENVKVTYCTLEELRERFQLKLGVHIALEDPRKLCDLKPMYGLLFEEELSGYQAWGYCDSTDTIFGDFSSFITYETINSFDKIGQYGHLTIYPNNLESVRRFMADSSGGRQPWRDCVQNKKICVFDEPGVDSIDAIWRHNGWTTKSLDDEAADLSNFSWSFRIAKGYANARKRGKNKCLIFEWYKGNLVGHEITECGAVSSRSYLYVHIKRRKMPIIGDVKPWHYLISPSGFLPAPDVIDARLLRKLGKEKIPDPMWFDAKLKNMKARLMR